MVRSNASPRRWLDRDHATHSARWSLLRRRHKPLPPYRSIPPNFPNRERVWKVDENEEESAWPEPGNSAIVCPMGEILGGPSRHEETILYAELDLAKVHAARRMFNPVGHYHRPDLFGSLSILAPVPQ